MTQQVVSFLADKPAPASAPDAWPWQSLLAWRLRLAVALVLAAAGLFTARHAFLWNADLAGVEFGLGLTAFLIGLMPCRHYFQRTHPALAWWLLGLWIAVLSISLLAATLAVTPLDVAAPETVAALDHEIELCNARNRPPRREIERRRLIAIERCPDYEAWFSYLIPNAFCWDARKFERDLAAIDRCKEADRRVMHLERHPQAPADWFPGWSYVATEAHQMAIRWIFVLIAGTAFWGFTESLNVILAEKPGAAGMVSPVSAPIATPVVPSKTQTESAFEAWASEYLIRDQNSDTPTELLRLAYRLACLGKGWPEYNGDAFSRKLASWTRERLKTFERDNAKKVPVYVGLTLKDDAITQEARRSFENGGA
jgi:hypothetical protein